MHCYIEIWNWALHRLTDKGVASFPLALREFLNKSRLEFRVFSARILGGVKISSRCRRVRNIYLVLCSTSCNLAFVKRQNWLSWAGRATWLPSCLSRRQSKMVWTYSRISCHDAESETSCVKLQSAKISRQIATFPQIFLVNEML